MNKENPIEIFTSADGESTVQVLMQDETVWLDRNQLAELFDRDVKTIGKHISNVFKEGELEKDSTVAKFATVQTEGQRSIKREIEHYNLDVIISVGYRVKSQRGTQFRIWATQRLREYLVQGYTLNQQRFDKNSEELQQALKLIQKASNSPELKTDEGRGLVEIVSRYTQTFLWLQRYDEGLLDDPKGQSGGDLTSPEDAMNSLNALKQQLIERGEATELFANPRGDGYPVY